MTQSPNKTDEHPATSPHKLSASQAEVLTLLAEEHRRLFQRAGQWLIRERGYVIGIPASNAELQELHQLGYIEAGHITDAGRHALVSWNHNPNS